jgi:hypothetical protein
MVGNKTRLDDLALGFWPVAVETFKLGIFKKS